MHTFLDLIHQLLDVDKWLGSFIREHGRVTYGLLAAIIFAETGLVIFPFLPGDSLLFTAGAFAARGDLNSWILALTLIGAAVLGDNTNYAIGRFLGPRVLRSNQSRLLSKKNLDKTHAFYEKHGAKAVMLARFVPIVRTFAPFVAGVGTMPYRRFLSFSVLGAVLWVGICVSAGYMFGNTKIVKENFEYVAIAIVIISVLPIGYEAVAQRMHIMKERAKKQAAGKSSVETKE